MLEVGPGTGAVTRKIVKLLRPDDVFDLVELNSEFVKLLNSRFESHADYQRVAEISQIHECPLQDFAADEPYDIVISGLPLNNFSPELVREIFDAYIKLLKPTGTLSYFEYMYVRPMRRKVVGKSERQRLRDLDGILQPILKQHRVKRDTVLMNVPPAWVQHLQFSDTGDQSTDAASGQTPA